MVKNNPRHSAGDLGDDRLPPLLDSKVYQMYQTGTSKTPAFMRPGRFQRKFESPLRYVYALAGSAEMYSCKIFYCKTYFV